MADADNTEVKRDELPFVAPCRSLSPWAPLRWLRLGVDDLLQAPQQSLVYGFIVALMIVVVSLLIGVATAFVGLVAIVPVIGYAAWHGYLETIDAEQFPRHSMGITSIPRREPDYNDDNSRTE